MQPFEETALAKGDSAYTHFARQLRQPVLGAEAQNRVQPALVRLRVGEDGLAAAQVERLADLIGKGAIAVEPDDAAHLLDLAEGRGDAGEPIVLSWPEADLADIADRFGDLFEILQLERPIIAPDPTPTLAAAPDLEAQHTTCEATPIVAVIDDGIGFLNTRFCRLRTRTDGQGRYRTRFQAVWLQAFRTITNPVFGPRYVHAGQVLYRSDINGLLAQGVALDEAAAYRALNLQLFEPGAHRSSEYSFTHGTHILDTAAGADPESQDPVIGWPLLAVQLPPEAVDNTAGTQLEPCIVKGVRWILRQAQRINAHSPVVINISFATFAGPKDGTKAIEALVAQALARWQVQTGRSARVVYAFGNDQLSRQAARMDLAPGVAQSIDWRLQPDDFAASYLELRMSDATEVGDMTLRITPPGGHGAQVIGPLSPNTSGPLYAAAGNIAGRIYHIGARATAPGVLSPAHAVLAMAPTAGQAGPTAPAGGWRLEVETPCPATLRIEVQRGDTPHGYRLNGRQSYLDHPLADGWEAQTASYNLPEPGCPITRNATHSSFVTALSHAVFAVGAARGDTLAPSPYSASGSGWTRLSPTLAAVADRGAGARGLIGAGTFSGSARALNGTSTAAARATRAIAHALEQGVIPVVAGPGDAAALIAAIGQPGAAADAARQGAGIVTGPLPYAAALVV